MGRTKVGTGSCCGTGATFDDTTWSSSGAVTHVGANQEDRYAVEFYHLYGPTTAQSNGHTLPSGNGPQFTFEGNTVMCPLNPMPYIWGIAVVDSHYGLIQDNTLYNWLGAGVYSDRTSSYNVVNHNFVMNITGTGVRLDQALQGDAYWFGTPLNTITNNVATDIDSAVAPAMPFPTAMATTSMRILPARKPFPPFREPTRLCLARARAST